jgi:DNA-binding NarL/FixJ family response regulator
MKVIFLSMHDEGAYFKKSMELGADGFVKKDAPVDELKNALLALTGKQVAIAA